MLVTVFIEEHKDKLDKFSINEAGKYCRGIDRMTGNGWEQKNRILFDSVVDEYERIRPEYPDAIFRDILHIVEKQKKPGMHWK